MDLHRNEGCVCYKTLLDCEQRRLENNGRHIVLDHVPDSQDNLGLGLPKPKMRISEGQFIPPGFAVTI
jgi:hypothetical protein